MPEPEFHAATLDALLWTPPAISLQSGESAEDEKGAALRQAVERLCADAEAELYVQARGLSIISDQKADASSHRFRRCWRLARCITT